jgi:hypothetical protein
MSSASKLLTLRLSHILRTCHFELATAFAWAAERARTGWPLLNTINKKLKSWSRSLRATAQQKEAALDGGINAALEGSRNTKTSQTRNKFSCLV